MTGILLSVTQVQMLGCWILFKPEHALSVPDDFMARFLSSLNLVFSALGALGSLTFGDFHFGDDFFFISGSPECQSQE